MFLTGLWYNPSENLFTNRTMSHIVRKWMDLYHRAVCVLGYDENAGETESTMELIPGERVQLNTVAGKAPLYYGRTVLSIRITKGDMMGL